MCFSFKWEKKQFFLSLNLIFWKKGNNTTCNFKFRSTTNHHYYHLTTYVKIRNIFVVCIFFNISENMINIFSINTKLYFNLYIHTLYINKNWAGVQNKSGMDFSEVKRFLFCPVENNTFCFIKAWFFWTNHVAFW